MYAFVCLHLNVEVLGSCSGHAWQILWVLPSSLLYKTLGHTLGHTQLVFHFLYPCFSLPHTVLFIKMFFVCQTLTNPDRHSYFFHCVSQLLVAHWLWSPLNLHPVIKWMHCVPIVPYANLHLDVPLARLPPLPPALPPAWLGLVSVWQALGPVRRPVGCDGQQLCVPLPAVWRPLGSHPGVQPAKVTSVQLRGEKKEKQAVVQTI